MTSSAQVPLSMAVPAGTLQNNTTYYARVRETGTILGNSAWSPDSVFTTLMAVGTAYQGGYFAGEIVIGGVNYAIITAPALLPVSGSIAAALNGYNQNNLLPTNVQDSAGNTTRLIANTSPAASAVRAMAGSTGYGYNDWQIAAADVFDVIAKSGILATSVYNGLATGSFASASTTPFWTSTAYDSATPYSYTTGGDPIYGTVNQVQSSPSYTENVIDIFNVSPTCPSGQTVANYAETDAGYTDANGIEMYTKSWQCTAPVQVVTGYTPIQTVSGTTYAYNATIYTYTNNPSAASGTPSFLNSYTISNVGRTANGVILPVRLVALPT